MSDEGMATGGAGPKRPEGILSAVIRMPPRDQSREELLERDELTVELEGGRRVRLDPGDPRSLGFAATLDGLSDLGLPVYLELNPEAATIARLLIPLVARVADLLPAEDGGLDVRLEPSHGRHWVKGGAPDFEDVTRRLREAMERRVPVVVIEDDSHEIFDVRDFTPGPKGPSFPLGPEPFPRPVPWWRRWLLLIWYWHWWPWWWFVCWFRCSSTATAKQAFAAMAATTCDPLTVPAPCIPFLYPDDGCWARAHEMCRLMVDMGLHPKKVWIQGSLHVVTKNNPNCYVDWGWHVAPTLCVRKSFFKCHDLVIDPALFDDPVTKATWKGVQGDPNATLTDSNWTDYYFGTTDPNYTDTNYYLSYFRLQLQNRANQQGPPPYAHC